MFRTSLLVAIAAISMIGAGCKKKVAVAPPPPPAQSAPSTAPTTTQPATRERAATTPAPTATTPQSRYPDAATRARINQLLTKFEDAYFDYDKHYLRPDAVKALEADSTELRDILAKYPDYKLTIEGHCDERGSEEYNIGLGDARAKAAKDYLVRVGVTADQLAVVSYGKDRPICQDHDEACWQKNRRVHIVAMTQPPAQ